MRQKRRAFLLAVSVNVTFRTHCNLNEEIHREIEKFVNNLRSVYNPEEPHSFSQYAMLNSLIEQMIGLVAI